MAAELAGQLWFFHAGWTLGSSPTFHEQAFEPHPYLVGRLKKGVEVREGARVLMRTTALGTRWTGAPEEADGRIRIAVLGGSTTFGVFLDDQDTWPAQLQARLGDRHAVYNFGIPGYSSAEAVIQTALVVPQVRPHVVVFFLGWNDLRNYHEAGLGTDFHSHGMRQYGHMQVPVTFTSPLTGLERRSALALLGRMIVDGTHPFENSDAFAPSVERPLTTPDPLVDENYVRNLRSLRALTRSIGAKAIFVPQILNDPAYLSSRESREWSRGVRDDALPGLMRRLNSFLDQACPEGDPDCRVLEPMEEFAWKPEHFVDEGHFSRAGGEQLAIFLADSITGLPDLGADHPE